MNINPNVFPSYYGVLGIYMHIMTRVVKPPQSNPSLKSRQIPVLPDANLNTPYPGSPGRGLF